MNCSTPGCRTKALTKLIMNRKEFPYCKKHFDESYNFLQEKKKNIEEAALNKLQEIKKKVSLSKKELIYSIENMIKRLENRFHELIIQNEEVTKNIEKIIQDLTNEEDSNDDIIDLFEKSERKAIKKIKSWDKAYNFSLNTKQLILSIEKFGEMIFNSDVFSKNSKFYSSKKEENKKGLENFALTFDESNNIRSTRMLKTTEENFESFFNSRVLKKSDEGHLVPERIEMAQTHKNREKLQRIIQTPKKVELNESLSLTPLNKKTDCTKTPRPTIINLKSAKIEVISLFSKNILYNLTLKQEIKRCPKNHSLIWNNSSVFVHFDRFKTFYIICNECRYKFSSSCWMCFPCSYNLCEKCGYKYGLTPSKLECLKKHELIWKPDPSTFDKNNLKKPSFTCNSCLFSKCESCWSCYKCNFNICFDCGKKEYNVSPFGLASLCRKKHPLIPSVCKVDKNGSVVKCFQCKKDLYKEHMICKECLFYICKECHEINMLSSAGHPILSCRELHIMILSRGENSQCCICFRNIKHERFQCFECLTHICLVCAATLIRIITDGIRKYHIEEKHIIDWKCKPESVNDFVSCLLCKKRFELSGMFCCAVCDFMVCAICYEKPNRPQTRNINK